MPHFHTVNNSDKTGGQPVTFTGRTVAIAKRKFEHRNIATLGNFDDDLFAVRLTNPLIVFKQLLAQPPSVIADDRIEPRFKCLATFEDGNSNGVFAQLSGASGHSFFHNEFKESLHPFRTDEAGAIQYLHHLRSNGIGGAINSMPWRAGKLNHSF